MRLASELSVGLYHVPQVAGLPAKSHGCMHSVLPMAWHWTDHDENITWIVCCVIVVLVSVGFLVEIIVVKDHE